MNIRYFYIKDHVDSGDISVEYCSTDEMIGDFFTKPLQGTKFKQMRDQIMNIAPNDKYHSAHRSVLNMSEESEVDEIVHRSVLNISEESEVDEIVYGDTVQDTDDVAQGVRTHTHEIG